ncbi:hypothetical protein AQUCO_01400446v1 [Aquilegia coerulea]|uniref:F-box domain-containing protein n=1 Tax=Aquilegia coerulea TaxID=218851 RepID=A0A2G5DWG8_AQUCA|nr:hypothetical protein AQUCO_01400446v1 [Aquilegia coerulea]
MVDLPKEMMDEILFRLPVKSLKRFRCVSKSWNTMIDNPSFARMHFNHQASQPVQENLKLMLYVYTYCSLYKVTYGNSDKVVEELNHSYKYETDRFSISGSCNGLFLEYPTFNLYTTKTIAWRTLRNVPITNSQYFDRMIIINAKLHWLAGRRSSGLDSSILILSFDLNNEEIREVPKPNFGEGKYDILDIKYVSYLYVFVNTVACYELWAMKDYGVKESWTKMVSISHSTIEHLCKLPYQRVEPLHLSENGQILLCIHRSALTGDTQTDNVVLYDSKNNKARIIKMLGARKRFRAMTYLETLILPNAVDDADVEELQRQL